MVRPKTLNKMDVIEALFSHKFTPEEIVDLTKENITKDGISINGKTLEIPPGSDLIKALGNYLRSKYPGLLQPYLFSSRSGDKWPTDNLVKSFGIWLKKNGNGKTLADYGLKAPNPRSKVNCNSMDDILAFLNKKEALISLENPSLDTVLKVAENSNKKTADQ